jgi:outer membrane protein
MHKTLLFFVSLYFLPAYMAGAFTLEECLKHARQTNPDYLQSIDAQVSAKAQAEVAHAERGPVVKAGISASVVSVVPELEMPERLVDTPVGMMTIPGFSRRLGDYDTYSLDLNIRQALYAGGLIAGAETDVLMSVQVLESESLVARNRLDTRVAGVYLSVLRLRELSQVQEQSLELAQKHADDVENQVDAGVLTRNELLKAGLRVTEAERECINTFHALESAMESLCIMTGLDIPLNELPKQMSLSDRSIPDKDTAIKTARVARPELTVINRRLARTRHSRDLIRREKRPNISAFAQVSYGKPGPDFIKNNWIDSYRAGINLSMSLWDYGRVNQRALYMDAEIRRIETGLQSLINTIHLEVTDARLAIANAKAQLEVAERAVDQAEENFRITADRFREGTLTNTDFLDAETALSTARSRRIIARMELNRAWIQYLYTTGADLLQEDGI